MHRYIVSPSAGVETIRMQLGPRASRESTHAIARSASEGDR